MKAEQTSLSTWAMLFTCALLWGSSFTITNLTIIHVTPVVLVFMRVSLAAIILTILGIFFRVPLPRTRRDLGLISLLGVLATALPFSLFFWAQLQITGSLASILNATVPIYTVILAQFVIPDERITLAKLFGCIIGAFGVVVTIGLTSFNGSTNLIVPQLACLLGSLSYASANMLARKLTHIPPITITAGQMTAASIVLLPVLPWVFDLGEITAAPIEVWYYVIILAVFNTALPFLLFIHVIKNSSATTASLVAFLVPIAAILIGSTVLGETLSLNQWMGMGIIATALFIIDGRLKLNILRVKKTNENAG